MKIIFSPSKEMREENIFENKKIEFTESKFKAKTNILINTLKQKSIDEIKNIMKLKGELLNKTYKGIQDYDKLKSIPTISMYYGVSFKELELEDYSEKSLKYLKNNLLILSALYKLISIYSKKARGKFLNYLIKNQINNLEDIKEVELDKYSLNKDLSDEKNFVFTRKNS
ncbi:peroxide stress protein YaaA [Fusobacterium vincentii]|uniref:peroxide stress protein YaaA n=1 Tax=Fusobacterium vincentii TaxID=155615 RepID=UPI0030D0200A